MRAAILGILAGTAAMAGLGGCVEIGPGATVMPGAADGARFFAANCASCHGADAMGKGPAAAGLPKAPADLTVLAERNGGTFPEARALSYIYGEPGESHLSRVMPEFGGAMAQDLVPVEIDGILTPTPRELAGLLVYLESIQR